MVESKVAGASGDYSYYIYDRIFTIESLEIRNLSSSALMGEQVHKSGKKR